MDDNENQNHLIDKCMSCGLNFRDYELVLLNDLMFVCFPCHKFWDAIRQQEGKLPGMLG